MAFQEIERKFLVKDTAYKKLAQQQHTIAQGYLSTDPKRSVRIRLCDAQGFITIKGASSPDGTSRFEWEREIDISEAKALLSLCKPTLVEKKRYVVSVGNHVFEVDEFTGANKGLCLAEIELGSADESFKKPKWLGKEVTGDPKYYNAQLSKHPFKSWHK